MTPYVLFPFPEILASLVSNGFLDSHGYTGFLDSHGSSGSLNSHGSPGSLWLPWFWFLGFP